MTYDVYLNIVKNNNLWCNTNYRLSIYWIYHCTSNESNVLPIYDHNTLSHFFLISIISRYFHFTYKYFQKCLSCIISCFLFCLLFIFHKWYISTEIQGIVQIKYRIISEIFIWQEFIILYIVFYYCWRRYYCCYLSYGEETL